MRVAVLTSSISRKAGGLYFSVSGLNREIAKLVDVKVFSAFDEYSGLDIHTWDGVKVSLGEQYFSSSVGFQPDLVKRLLDYKPNLIHLNGIWMYPSVAAFFCTTRFDFPVVVSPRGMLDDWAMQNSWYKKVLPWHFYVKPLLRKAAVIHALTTSEQDSIKDLELGTSTVVIPNGVDSSGACLGNSVDKSEDKLTSIIEMAAHGKRVVLFIGRLHPKKGVDILMSAWRQFADHSRHRYLLVIAGEGAKDFEVTLHGYLDESGTYNDIFLVGPVYGDRKRRLYESASLFVLPSFSEGQPMAILEALSFGIPCLISKACNIPEAIKSGAALEIEPSERSIVDGLCEFDEKSDSYIANMSAQALNQSRQYTWELSARAMVEVYSDILANKAVSAGMG